MAQKFEEVLTAAEITYILALPEVVAAKERLDATAGDHSMVYLNLALPGPIRQALEARLGVHLSAVTSVPLRWIKGDSLPHVDHTLSGGAFDTTYLMYLTNSPGQLVLDGSAYPIEQNTAYKFSEGVSHETMGASGTSRLLIGPMNEAGLAVGSPVVYFSNKADADAGTNVLAYGGSYTLSVEGGFSSWRISSVFTSGSSSQAVVYTAGQTLNNDGIYYLYPAAPCFLRGSKILCQVDGKEEWKPVEELKPGDLVKTSRDGFKPVKLIGYSKMKNSGTSDRVEERLYKLTPTAYPTLTEDLFVTGAHSILVDELTEVQREGTKKTLGNIFVTDRKYRLMAWLDDKAEPWVAEGEYEVWHFALEHSDIYMNYGIYANGGLLVESCNIRFLRDKSNMTLLS